MKDFTPKAKEVVGVYAQDEARKLGSRLLLPEHVMLAMIKNRVGLGFSVFKKLFIDPNELLKFLNKFFEGEPKSPTLDLIPAGRRYQVMLDFASMESETLKNDYIATEHLLLAAIREEGSVVSQFFKAVDYTITDVRHTIKSLQKESYAAQQLDSILFEGLFSSFNDHTNVNDELFEGLENKLQNQNPAKNEKEQKKSFLAEYSRDLTAIARENKDDPVIGRDKEIHRVIQILSRRTKNNPVLTGEPGVGKTAIVEGLAQRIAQGKVPSDLLKKRVLSLDLAAIVAGTKYRGEFEERMKKMLNELKEDKSIILFIDELHSIIGAGGNEGTMDASNIMKPALSRGEIQIIGATTTKEYTKHIEKDLALERRFQVVKVEEPTVEETEKILEGIKAKYEKYHHVVYAEDVIPSVVRLSKRYIPEKVLPDKAIDILDEAGAAKKIQEENSPSELMELELQKDALEKEKRNLIDTQDYERAALVRDKVKQLREKLVEYTEHWNNEKASPSKTVTSSDIEKIISEMTGIPVSRLTSSEAERIINMEAELHKTVIGQESAISLISSAIRRSRAGIASPKHPVGSFIFLGPTGVGKTQAAKALAKYLFGSEESLIRVDMSDYMEKHNASRLVGAPPGYVGYEEGGVLTEKVRRHPYSVVLLDEIEKAHPDVFNLLLQLLEEGELSDNLGHTVNFRNTVVIMTSNAGARQIMNEGKVGFGLTQGEELISYDEMKASAMGELKKILNPELINRIDDIVVFDALTRKEVSKILDIQIADLAQRLSEKNITISVKPKAKAYLIENGYNPAMGARPMARLLRKEVEDPLALEILAKKDKEPSVAVVECTNGKIRVKLEPLQKENALKVPVLVTSK